MNTGDFNATSAAKAVCDLRNLLLEHEAPDCDYLSIEAEQVFAASTTPVLNSCPKASGETSLNFITSVGSVLLQNDDDSPQNAL
jgi:hypothetical protein